MKLGEILEGMRDYDFEGDRELDILGITYDSRQVRPGHLFVAIRGNSADGHDYLGSAVESGAIALVAEDFGNFKGRASKIRVSNYINKSGVITITITFQFVFTSVTHKSIIVFY